MKKYSVEKHSKRWLFILFVVMIAYAIGFSSAVFHIFPYQQLKYIKVCFIPEKEIGLKAGKEKFSDDYYCDKRSFFEVNGIKANIVMIGDSITDRGEWNELFPTISIVKRAISGDTTEGVLNRMESIYATNAKKAFIMIGVNDLGKNASIDKVFSNYKKIVTHLKQHGIKPYIESVLFLGDKYSHRNNDILKLNLRLKALSKKEKIVFIDLNNVLSENGKLKKSFSSKDDIHLNGEGFFVWKSSIKKYMQ